jgi:hypothetical protein
MEKLLEKHFRETCLTERPLCLNQHAYQSGRSCESVLRQLVLQIEKSLENQETAPGAFLDIQWASDTSFESMILAVSNHVIDTCYRWLTAMLQGRQFHATMFNETLQVSVAKECQQGGVLYPLLWDLVVDDPLVTMNNQGFYTQGYADDIVILILGKHINTVS